MSAALGGAVAERVSFRSRLTGAVAATVLRLMAASWRVRTSGLDVLDAAFAARRPLLLVFWHGKYVPLFVLLRGRHGMVFTSRSRRGAAIAEISRRFDYHCTQLPVDDGEDPYARMREALAGELAAGIAVDGPLGPYHTVKRGAILLASELGWPLFPLAVAASRARVAHQRWDRMETPRLFSRVGFAVGPPLEVPPALPADQLSGWQRRVGEALAAADARAAALLER